MQSDTITIKKIIDPRKSLEDFYNLSLVENIPTLIADKALNTDNELPSNTYFVEQNDHNLTKEVISKIFEDPRITLEQREQISKSILYNKIKIIEGKPLKSKPFLISKDHEKQRIANLTTNRHKLQKPRFLNLEATSIDIPSISNKEMHIQKINFLRSQYQSRSIGNLNSILSNQVALSRTLDDISSENEITDNNNMRKNKILILDDSRLNTPFTTRPLTTNTQTKPINTHSKTKKTEEPTAREIQVKLLAEYKKKLLEESRLSSEQKRNESLQLKRQERDIMQRKMQIKKKLNEFRRKLSQYLIDTKNLMIGTIMRCVDESMVYHFMQTYQGFAMSVEAILAILGNALGTSIVNPTIPTAAMGDDDIIKLPTEKGISDGIFQEQGIKHLNPFGVLFKTSSKLQLPPLDFQETERVSTGFVNKGLLNSRDGKLNNTTPISDMIYPNNGSDDDLSMNCIDNNFDDNNNNNEDMSNKQHNIHTSSDPVQGYEHTKYRTNTKPTIPDSKTLGSGFRILRPHLISINKSEYLSTTNRPISPINMSLKSILHNPQQLVVFGSENLRVVAQEMGFEYQAQEGLKKQEMQSNEDYDDSLKAINALHQQLMEEEQLPSMQPEKVLSEQQIEDLGSHKKSFNYILNEVNQNNKQQSYSNSTINNTDKQLNLDDESPYPSFLITNNIRCDNSFNIDDSIYASQIIEDMSIESPNKIEMIIDNKEASNIDYTQRIESFQIPIVSSAGLLSHLKHTGDANESRQYHKGLYGTILHSTDRLRFQQLTELEIDRGKLRLGLETLAPYSDHIKKASRFRGIGKAPMAIKTTSTMYPMNPYSGNEEETMIMNAGIPSGTGLMLWRPRVNVAKDGRYRIGIIKGSNNTSINHRIDHNYKKPFIPNV